MGETIIVAAITALITGIITAILQERRLKRELEAYKTEFMAEKTAKVFLNNKRHLYRSFDVLKKHLGGFEEDELRKILVRAGAIREYKEEKEMWTLLERSQEYYKKKRENAS